jgi:cell division protein FtsB
MAGLVLAAAFLGITVQANALEREKAALRADIAAAQAEQAARTAHIAEQKTQDYVRDKARDFGFIGANESLIAVERSGQTSGSEVPAVSEAWSRIGRWIAFFFGPR